MDGRKKPGKSAKKLTEKIETAIRAEDEKPFAVKN